MEQTVYVCVGDLVKVNNSTVGLVAAIDVTALKPISVFFYTGEIITYSTPTIEILSTLFQR